MRETDKVKSPLGTHISLIGFGALFFIIAVAVLSIWQDFRNTRAWALRHAQTMSQNLAEHAARSLDAVNLTLLTVKKQAERDRVSEHRSSQEIINEFEDYIAALPQVRGLILTDQAGIIRYTERKKSIGMDIHDRKYFQHHLNSKDNQLYMGKPLVGRTTGRWFFSTSRKILKPDGSFDGIAMALVTQGYFKEFYDRVESEQDISAAYVTRAGMIFAASGKFSSEFEDVAGKVVNFIGRGEGGVSTGRFIGTLFTNGTIRVVSYALVSGYPIYLVTSTPVNVALTPWRQRTQTIALLVLGACMVLLGLVYAANKHYSKRAAAEADLRAGEQRFRDIAEAASDWFYEMDENLRYTYISSRFYEVSGYHPEEIIGNTSSFLQADENDNENWGEHSVDLENRQPFSDFQYTMTTRDGGKRSISVSGIPVFDSENRFLGYRGAARDITRRKQDEKNLLEKEQRYHSVITTSHDGFWLTDLQGNILDVNEAYCQRSGYSRDEILSMKISELIANPSDEIIATHFRTVVELGSDLFASRHRSKNGDVWPVEISNSYDSEQGGRVFSFIRDITERQRMEKQARRSQKLEAVGQLTGGIAHDFNNILGIVMGNLQILQRLIPDDENVKKRLGIALKGVSRGADLTRKLLGFSRQEVYGAKLTSVNEFIENLEELLARSLTVAINVEHHLGDDLWKVEVDPGDFQDAVLNLALNSRDAMPDGGNLVIETANKVLDDSYVQQNPHCRTGEFVMLSVSDTGQGMTAKIRENVFEPFFSTKEEGKGTGLGLSMVYGFVQRSGGQINIYSEPGEGTTINIYLPRALDAQEGDSNEVAESHLPRGNETILVVDDEEQLVEIAVLHLQQLGYRTLSAQNGVQALAILKEHPEIDLLFSDVIMPGGMDGYELAVEAINERPNFKVLLTSGFTKKREKMATEDKEIYAEMAANLLSKPYTQEELAVIIRHILDKG